MPMLPRAGFRFYVPLLSSALCAVLAIGYFVLTFRYYPAVASAVLGKSPEPVAIEVYFDTGQGLTGYEHLPLQMSSYDQATGEFLGEAKLPPQPLRQLRFDVPSGSKRVK